MNHYGFLEISHIKNDAQYKVLLPFGTPWPDAVEALKEIQDHIDKIIKQLEEQQINVSKKEEQNSSNTQ
jgi:hypothetical protein